jgi:hypothetical protein
MKTTTLVTCAVILLSVMLVVSFHQLTFAQTETTESEQVKLNTVSLDFTSAQVHPSEGNQVVRAFVPTGSKSVKSLASLNEIRKNVWSAGITVFWGRERLSLLGVSPEYWFQCRTRVPDSSSQER